MIISRERKYIFLHSRKTAGSSVSVSLAKNLAPDDIMIGCWPDAYRYGISYNEFALGIAKENPVSYFYFALKNKLRYGRFEPKPTYINRTIKQYFRIHHGFNAGAHSPAAVVRKFDPELWSDAFKFAFVRNPWTHAVSNYWWCTRPRRKRNVSFKEYLLRLDDPNRPDPERVRPSIITNWPVYTIDDRMAVDFIGRYENIEQDLGYISERLGFDVSIGSIGAKKESQRQEKSVVEHYDDEGIELVRRIYKKEIDAFSYKMPF